MSDVEPDNLSVRNAWDTNSRFWDSRMADGNEFFNRLVWPGVEALLGPLPGERLIDVACGNGVASRRLAAAGARVVALDFSKELIRLARERSSRSDTDQVDQIDYRILDLTDGEALRGLGKASFDGILCNMALMDLADTRPLFQAAPLLLRPGGRFVFSVLHPCFNNPAIVQMGELQDREGTLVTTYSVKVSRYGTPYTQVGSAIPGQPVPHPYFHRPLGILLRPAFDAGLLLDALEERAFPPESGGGSSELSWSGLFSEIPPVLVGRMRPRAG
jgi:2-polyprenyl-3-methyl-5-hydroxy-6-metoxy-1,4-benzoquinol methylase